MYMVMIPLKLIMHPGIGYGRVNRKVTQLLMSGNLGILGKLITVFFVGVVAFKSGIEEYAVA